MAMIEVKNVTKSYPIPKQKGRLTVLKNFSVDFDQEGVTVLLGPSGTGKSTLLRCINGLETIDKGDIIVNGLSVRDKRNHTKICIDCGMVFQHTTLFPQYDVLHNLTISPIKLLHTPRKEAEEKAAYYLDKVGLSGKVHAKHNELSGGEKQRISIARALMMNPKALLLDEITSALDPEMTQEVLTILRKLADEGVCMLAVTHEMSFARNVASRILFMEKGALVCDTSVEDFFGNIRSHNERVKRFLETIGV